MVSYEKYIRKNRVEYIPSGMEVVGVLTTVKEVRIMIQSELISDDKRVSGNGLFVTLLDLTTVAVPNLIGPDLVLTHPMSDFSGYVC